MKHRALVPFFILLFSFPSLSESPGSEGKVSFSNLQIFLGYSGEGFLSARTPLDPKLQGESRFSAGLRQAIPIGESRWTPFLLLRGDLVYRGTSNLSDGYLYNGLNGGAFAFGGGVLFPQNQGKAAPLSGTAPGGRFGLAGGFSAGLFGYTTGLNYFYFPALFLEPSWEIPELMVRAWGALGLRVSMPLTWELRKDLDLSVGTGISLQAVYTPPRRRSP
jgi:hypothetical protein